MVSVVLMPLNMVILLLLFAILLRNRQPKLSTKMLLSGTIMLIIVSLAPVADFLMAPLEQKYDSFSRSANPVDYIVILGCGHTSNDALAPTQQLKDCSLRRLVEGVRVSRIHPEATIITSGFSGADPVSNATKVKQAAIALGVPANKIITENYPKDTREESELIAPRVKGTNVVLVTDADHLPRAMVYFEQQGVIAMPAPAGYWVKNSEKVLSWGHYIPSSRNITQISIAWYETLGRAWQWLSSKL